MKHIAAALTCALLGCGSATDDLVLSNTSLGTGGLANLSSWLDCSVERPKFRQGCSLSDRSEQVTHVFAADAGSRVARILGEQADPDSLMTPHLRLSAFWAGPPKCSNNPFPAEGPLQVLAQGKILGEVTSEAPELNVSLRDEEGGALWALEESETSAVIVGSNLQLVDSRSDTNREKWLLMTYSRSCDFAVRAELTYRWDAMEGELRRLKGLLSVQERLLNKERLIHALLLNGRGSALCLLRRNADALLAEDHAGRRTDASLWIGASSEVLAKGKLLLEAAVQAGIVAYGAIEEGGEREYLAALPACSSHDAEVNEPTVHAFMHSEQPSNQQGVANAQEFARDSKSHAENAERYRDLQVVLESGGGSR